MHGSWWSLALVSCLVAPAAAQGTIGFGGGGAGGKTQPVVPGLENDPIRICQPQFVKAKAIAVGRVVGLERVDVISRKKATGRDGFEVLERHTVEFEVSEVLRGKLTAGKTIKAEFKIRFFTAEPEVRYTEGLSSPLAKVGTPGILLLDRKGRNWHSILLVVGTDHGLADARGEDLAKMASYPPEDCLAYLGARARYFETLSKLQAAQTVLQQSKKRTRAARAASKWATKGLGLLNEHKQALLKLRLTKDRIAPFAEQLTRVSEALKAEQARLRL